tara:strand:+ start:79 stop:717 length:639 start_codon:yes stop_codon:yes gene_type:complete
MKTTKITLILFALLTITYSCKKKKIAPTLTLIGESSITLCLGGVFTDPGAESIDAYDDDISADIESTGSVNVDSVGSYSIEYTSTDKNDNVSVLSRTVNVVVCVDNLLGDYTVDDDCGSQLADTHTISAGANQNEIIIDNVVTLVGGQVTGLLSGSTITVSEQEIDLTAGKFTISGTGTINSNATEIVFDYTWDNSIPFIGGSGTCTATYTK